MRIVPITDHCRHVFDQNHAAVFGISPFNSYFSESRIAWLADWALKRCSEVYFYLPDGPSVYTLEALGYPPSKAARKARRQSTWLRNKILRAIESVSIRTNPPDDHVVDSAWLADNEVYSRLLIEAQQQYDSNLAFRTACQRCTNWVLRNQLDNPSPAAIDLAVRYLLAEFPLIGHASEVLRCPSAVFCYHQCPDFVADLYEGRFGQITAPTQGFVVVRPASDDRSQQSAPNRSMQCDSQQAHKTEG